MRLNYNSQLLSKKLINSIFYLCIGLAFCGDATMPTNGEIPYVYDLAYLARVPFLISIYTPFTSLALMAMLVIGFHIKPDKWEYLYKITASTLIILLWIFSIFCTMQMTRVN
jgi:hypothetical protein